MAKKKADKMGFGTDRRFKQSKFGNQPVRAAVGGKDCRFRSKLEYRYAQYLQMLKESGHINEWFFEEQTFEFVGQKIDRYLPDFTVHDEEFLEVHECKGFLQKRDLDKLKGMFEEYPEVKLTIIFAVKPKISTQKMNKLNRYCYRIITNGNTLFRQAGIM